MNIFESWVATTPIAHRGLFNDKYPENSLSAFKNAVKNKLPIELNVTCLADGTPVIFHDQKLARMTGKDGFISMLNYEDLSKLYLAGTKEKIPTLKEALATIDGKVPVLIEIKNYGKVGLIEKQIWKVLQGYSGEYMVESFNPYSLEWFKLNAPNIRRGQIASFFKNKEIVGAKRFALKHMLYNKKVSEPNFIVYNVEDMPNRFVKKYFGVIPVVVSVVNNEETERKAKEFSNNIIFDGFIPTALKDKIKD